MHATCKSKAKIVKIERGGIMHYNLLAEVLNHISVVYYFNYLVAMLSKFLIGSIAETMTFLNPQVVLQCQKVTNKVIEDKEIQRVEIGQDIQNNMIFKESKESKGYCVRMGKNKILDSRKICS